MRNAPLLSAPSLLPGPVRVLIAMAVAAALLWPAGPLFAQVTNATDAGGAEATGDAPDVPDVTPPDAAPRPDAAELAMDLSSPRDTLLTTYFPAINRINREADAADEAWEHVLATMQWEGVVNEAEARLAARRLLEVFDKLGRVTEDHLPGDRDLQETAISRFVFFPQPDHHGWVWNELSAFNRWPQGEIVLVRTAAGWQFSAETVRNIGGLAESIAPLQPRHLAPQLYTPDVTEQVMGLLGPTFEHTLWWGWLALLGLIFGGLLVGKVLNVGLRRAGDRLRSRGWEMRATAFDNAASPASLACLTLALTIGLQVFIVIEEDSALEAFVLNTLTLLYLLALGWFLFNLVDILDLSLRRVTHKTQNRIDDMIVPLIRKALRIFLVVIFTLVVAQNVFGLNITGWLAGLGIAGLAVSLAAQDSIRNLFGSLTVFFDKPCKVGDFITFEGSSGTVEAIGFRSTRLRLLSGHLLTVPNMKFIDSNVENITARPAIRREMNVTITYDTPPDKIEQAVQIVKDVLHEPEVVEEGQFDLETQPPRVAFDELKADCLNIKAFYWYQMADNPDRGWYTYLDHCERVNLLLFRRFQKAGIDFAFPTQTLYLAGDTDRQLALRLLPEHAAGDGSPNRGNGQ